MEIFNPEQPIGSITYASSEPEGGCDVGALLRLSETDFIWCGEITRKEAAAANIADTGWHIVFHQGAEHRVVAQVPEGYVAVEMLESIAAAIRKEGV